MSNQDEKSLAEQVNSRLDDLFGGDDDESAADAAPSFDAAGSGDAMTEVEEDARADHLFQDADAGEGSQPSDTEEAESDDADEPPPSPIQDLKSVIFSLEWEITDPIMQKLGEEIQKLESTFSSEKIVVAFLQLLGSLGKYIRKKRANAHPDSIRLLHSVFESLESVVIGDLSDGEKKKLLISQVNQYKKLKENIAVAKAAAVEDETPPPEPPPEPVAPPAADYRIPPPAEDEAMYMSGEDEEEYIMAPDVGELIQVSQEISQKMDEMHRMLLTELRELRKDLQRVLSGNV